MVGLQSSSLLPEESRALEELRPLGIIIFRHNIDGASNPCSVGWIEKLAELIESVKAITNRPDLLIAIDHEGGKVTRLPQPVTQFPAARHWQNHSREVGVIMGRELRSLGFNLTFSPVLDVVTEEQNSVIGPRAFAQRPEDVAKLALEHRDGLQKSGLLTVGKHFPGHGGTIADSHFELPVYSGTIQELEDSHLVPFRRAIAEHIEILMPAHVIYKALDPNLPATLSRFILHDLLRAKLGFSGALVSDALEMRALAHYTRRELVVAALNAGINILLWALPNPHPPAVLALEAQASLKKALEDNSVEADTIRSSLVYINRLLELSRGLVSGIQASGFESLPLESHRLLAHNITQQINTEGNS